MVESSGSSRPPQDDAPTPLWVYVGGVVMILIALAFVAMHLAGGIPSH